MIQVGDKRDSIPKEIITAATFHPFKDIWWLLIDNHSVVTVERRVVTKVDLFETQDGARKEFFRLLTQPVEVPVNDLYNGVKRDR